MNYGLLADAVVVVHLAFVVFVVAGGLLLFVVPRMIWLHLPALVWGVVVEATGWLCPLTPLENHWRALAGRTAYEDGFVSYHLVPILYPEGLTREGQILLALALVGFNGVVYALFAVRRMHRGRGRQA